MTLRSRATPAAYRTLTQSLDELERTDSAVAKARRNLDSVTAGILRDARQESYLQQRYEALRCALTRPCVARHEEPGELVSTANKKDISVAAMHARRSGVKSKRALGERVARTFCVKGPPEFVKMELTFAVVVITRIAPRLLDSDNLESACKALRDGIAAGLGIDDRSSLVRYVVSQQQGEPRQHLIRAELFIEPTQGEAP